MTIDIDDGGNPLYIVSKEIAEGIDASEAAGELTPEIAAIAEPLDSDLESSSSFVPAPNSSSSCGSKPYTYSRALNLAGHPFGKSFDLDDGFTGSFGVNGNVEGAITGQVNLDLKRKKVLFWCVPYAAKFKNVHIFGDANANAGITLSGTIAYQHSFEPVDIAKPELFSVLFFAGPVPVRIGFNLPIIAGLDLKADVTGSITYNGSHVITGSFDWVCTLDDCSGGGNYDTDAGNTTQTITGSVSGRLKPEPYVDIGFRAYLYFDSLAYGQVGLRPYLMGDLWGYTGNNCGDADGDGTFETVQALTFDLDRRVDLTAEAGALGDLLGGPWRKTMKTGSVSHVGFYDLIGSSALAPELHGPATAKAGTPSEYLVKIRPCWPYDKKITYQLNWGDGSAVEQSVETDPAAYLRATHTWAAAGSPTVTATSYRDKHGRALGQSTSRTIQVCPTLAITAQPQAATLNSGQSATMSVTSNGTMFQWYRGNSGDTTNPVAGGTGSSIVVTPDATTAYWVRVSNVCGEQTSSNAATVTVNFVCQVDGTACGGDGNHTCQGGQCVCSNCASAVCCGASGNTRCDGQSHYDANTGYIGTCASTLAACTAANEFSGADNMFHDGEVRACVKSNGTYQWAVRRPSPRCQEVSPLCGFVCSTHYNNGVGFLCDQDGNWNSSLLSYCYGGTIPAGWSCQTCVAPQITSQPQPSSIQQGQSASLSVAASGTSPTFQWYRGTSGDTSNPAAGDTGTSIMVAPTGTTSYWAQVSTACGQVNSQTATVTVTPLTVTVSPKAVSVQPGSSQQFSSAVQGTTNTRVTWTISPTGTAAGSIDPNNGLYLAPSSITTVTSVTVTATSKSDNVTKDTAQVSLVVSSAVLNPPALTFAAQDVNTTSASQAITLSNQGTAAFSLSSITTTGEFSQTNNCGSALAPGGSCTLNVNFTPTGIGTRTGTVRVTDSAPGSPQIANLTGTGRGPTASLSPNSLDFGGQRAGFPTVAQTVSLVNTGTGTMSISSTSVTADFITLSNNCGTSLAAGASCAISLAFSPAATSLGQRLGTLQVVSNAPGSPHTASLRGSVFGGFHDEASCDGSTGWAWDSSQPNTPITVYVFEGSSLLGAVVADKYRGDLPGAGIGNGYHAFDWTMPAAMLDGVQHTITIRFSPDPNALPIPGSPKSVTCTPLPNLQGYHDTASCAELTGWAWDASQSYSPVYVYFYEGTHYLGAMLADQYRQDLVNAGIGDGRHGFAWPIQSNLIDGQPHSLSVLLGNSWTSPALIGSPKTITCAPAPPPTASISWIQPAESSWGPAGTLTAAGFAYNGTGGVQLVWRERSGSGVWVGWTAVAGAPEPNTWNGGWSNTISSGNPTNICHWFEAYVNYSGISSPVIQYNGTPGCP